jgi:predicted Rossmann fold nucleotide-binding protein DprA/Smf involved in DNA uptake
MTKSTDAQTILLLCSHLGLGSNPDPAPLTLREWNSLSQQLTASGKKPGGLLDLTSGEIKTALDLPDDLAERLEALLGRRAGLAIELERLESLGIWVLTREDEDYPARLRERLQDAAPPILFGAGETTLIGQAGLAVVGSRSVDDNGKSIAEFIGAACATCGLMVYSGAAQGVDRLAMTASLEREGRAVGILADSLEKTIRNPEIRTSLAGGDLALLTPYSPKAGFSVGAAMGRNKLIYALADYALVVASEAGSGGTWAGATEALKARWIPVFVCDSPDIPDGNRQLIMKGAIPFPTPFPDSPDRLGQWLTDHKGEPAQGSFF